MQDWQLEIFELRSRSDIYKRRVDESHEIIRGALRLMERPYVAFSCGKDSSVLSHMVLQHASVPLRFLASGETRIVHNVDDIIGWFRERGATVEEILIDRVFSEEWQDATWDEQRKAGRGDLCRLTVDHDGVFMGLRMEESGNRKRSLLKHQTPGLPPFCYRYRSSSKMHDMIRCCPLAKWTVEDVGAYIVTHGIPVLRHYHNCGLESRTTARLTGDAVRNNELFWIKAQNPEGWQRLLQRFPEFGLWA